MLTIALGIILAYALIVLSPLIVLIAIPIFILIGTQAIATSGGNGNGGWILVIALFIALFTVLFIIAHGVDLIIAKRNKCKAHTK